MGPLRYTPGIDAAGDEVIGHAGAIRQAGEEMFTYLGQMRESGQLPGEGIEGAMIAPAVEHRVRRVRRQEEQFGIAVKDAYANMIATDMRYATSDRTPPDAAPAPRRPGRPGCAGSTFPVDASQTWGARVREQQHQWFGVRGIRRSIRTGASRPPPSTVSPGRTPPPPPAAPPAPRPPGQPERQRMSRCRSCS